jgi:DNA repair protein SbcC/Rad50
MIPIRLSLRNFMCYRENVPPLDFTGIHTACISGDNGNGKSALIDAMTWALWGRSRAIRSDDDLINLLADEMEVDFEFAVGGQGYRIIRKHARPKKRARSGQSLLEFQTATAEGFRSISGDSIPLTQQKIIGVLHMDYETFINSAYLRQGHADEFATRRPVERKQVLADILGLSVYDEMEARAGALAKQLETEVSRLGGAISESVTELADRPAVAASLELAETTLAGIEKELTEKESALAALKQKRDALEGTRQQLLQLEAHLAATRRELERRERETGEHQARIREYEALIGQRPAIEADYTRLAAARDRNESLNQKLSLLVRLQDSRGQLEMRIEKAQAALIAEHRVVQNTIAELETRIQRLPALREELRQGEARQRQLADQDAALNGKKQAARERSGQLHHLEAEKARLDHELTDLAEKLSLLLTPEGASCPLCHTELGEAGLERIRSSYLADKEARTAARDQVLATLAAGKIELETLEKETSRLETELNRERAFLQSRMGVLNQAITEIQIAETRLGEAREKLAAIEQNLARKDFVAAEQQALAGVTAELIGLEYHAGEHEEVRRQIIELGPFEASWLQLQKAANLLSQERDSRHEAEEAGRELRQTLETETLRKQEIDRELEAMPSLAAALDEAATACNDAGARKKQAQENLWTVKARLARLVELESKKQEKETQQAQAREEAGTYLELARAFGKSGIQALLIEAALPEIEAEANRLLSRMTDNRMHVKIETQRLTRKGDTQETLDITIADELGTRPYETYSGGEAFRINFAVRIALSRLLAHRAGAPLPTLIIDEGFGTLDVTGIEKITEAINSIQGEFEKILVITHIEELRDAFPTRIDVVKTAAGTTLTVS